MQEIRALLGIQNLQGGLAENVNTRIIVLNLNYGCLNCYRDSLCCLLHDAPTLMSRFLPYTSLAMARPVYSSADLCLRTVDESSTSKSQ